VAVAKAERRSQAERRDEAEQRLLAAAVRLVAERGLERITLASHLVEGFGRALDRTEHHGPGLPRLIGTVAFYFDSARKDPIRTRALFVVLAEGLNNGLISGQIAALNARSAKTFEVNIRAAVKAGDARADVDAKAMGILVLAGLRGAVGQWLLAPGEIDLDAVRDAFVRSLTLSLAP
jgi:AcrR family transcriptional regulator